MFFLQKTWVLATLEAELGSHVHAPSLMRKAWVGWFAVGDLKGEHRSWPLLPAFDQFGPGDKLTIGDQMNISSAFISF